MALKWSPIKRRDRLKANNNKRYNNKNENNQNPKENVNRAENIKQSTNLLFTSQSLVPNKTTMVTMYISPSAASMSTLFMGCTEPMPVPLYTNTSSYTTYNSYPHNPFNNWNTIITTIPIAETIYTMPITTAPIIYELPQMCSPQAYLNGNIVTQNVHTAPVFSIPVFKPFVPPPNFGYEQPIVEEVYNASQEEMFIKVITNTASTDSITANVILNTPNTSFNKPTCFNIANSCNNVANTLAVTPRLNFLGPVTRGEPAESLEYYLQLPKEIFPPPRCMRIDPNPIIDAFCKLREAQSQLAWISDLEFGVPRLPVTRHIAQYDIKMSNVVCKNAACTTHPDFESCSQEFKHTFSLYYNFIISAWYRGFLSLKRNKNRACFEAWLNTPMESLGMCWP